MHEKPGVESGDDREREIRESIARLTSLRDDWSSEIPEEVLHSDSDDGQHKVRNAWFGGVIGELDLLLIDHEEDPEAAEFVAEAQAFVAKYKSPADWKDKSGFGDRLTTADDIASGDAIINKAIDFLESL